MNKIFESMAATGVALEHGWHWNMGRPVSDPGEMTIALCWYLNTSGPIKVRGSGWRRHVKITGIAQYNRYQDSSYYAEGNKRSSLLGSNGVKRVSNNQQGSSACGCKGAGAGMSDADSGTRRQGADGVSRAGTGTVRLQARDVRDCVKQKH